MSVRAKGGGGVGTGAGAVVVVVVVTCCSETLPAHFTGKPGGQGRKRPTPSRQHLVRKGSFLTIHVAPDATLFLKWPGSRWRRWD